MGMLGDCGGFGMIWGLVLGGGLGGWFWRG